MKINDEKDCKKMLPRIQNSSSVFVILVFIIALNILDISIDIY